MPPPALRVETPPGLRSVRQDRLGALHSRLLTPADAGALTALRDRVLADLPDPDLYVRERDEEAFVRMHLGSVNGLCRGETLGVFDGERLVAYAMLGLPAPDDEDNLGRHFAPGITEPARTAHLTSCMVLKPYRGQHLQRMLLVARMALAQAHGRDFCVAMVSLRNHASRHNMMRERLRIGWVGEIDGLQRQLLAIRAGDQGVFDRRTLRLVDSDDWQRQCDLTRQGWWGIDAYQARPGHYKLGFARPS